MGYRLYVSSLYGDEEIEMGKLLGYVDIMSYESLRNLTNYCVASDIEINDVGAYMSFQVVMNAKEFREWIELYIADKNRFDPIFFENGSTNKTIDSWDGLKELVDNDEPKLLYWA